MKAMKIRRRVSRAYHDLREKDGFVHGAVQTKHGDVAVLYRAATARALLELEIERCYYQTTLNGYLSQCDLLLAARAFAEQCWEMHEKGGSR